MMLNKGNVLEVACLQLDDPWNPLQLCNRFPNRRKCSSNDIRYERFLLMKNYSIQSPSSYRNNSHWLYTLGSSNRKKTICGVTFQRKKPFALSYATLNHFVIRPDRDSFHDRLHSFDWCRSRRHSALIRRYVWWPPELRAR